MPEPAGERDHPDHPDHPDHLDPLAHVAQTDHPDAIANARADAARAIRDIGHALVGHHASIELVDRVADGLDRLTGELSAGPSRTRAEEPPTGQWGPAPIDGEIMTSYDERPISGRSSPWGLDLEIRRDGDDAVARLTLRAAHEGAPHRSHGGIVAALLDDMYGFVLTLNTQPAFTGELKVRYEAGVPIGRELECRVRLVGRERRKLFMEGELRDGDHVLARSTATFIAIDPERFRQLDAG